MLSNIAQELRQIAAMIEEEIIGRPPQNVPMNALERFLADLERVYAKHGLAISVAMRDGGCRLMICDYCKDDLDAVRAATQTRAAAERLKMNDEPPF